jgi:hypothetical protein
MTPDDAVRALAEERGIVVVLEGRCPGGEVGAYFVRTDVGAQYVLKWSDDTDDLDFFQRLVPLLSKLKADGYPMPSYLPPFRVDAGIVLLQRARSGHVERRRQLTTG